VRLTLSEAEVFFVLISGLRLRSAALSILFDKVVILAPLSHLEYTFDDVAISAPLSLLEYTFNDIAISAPLSRLGFVQAP